MLKSVASDLILIILGPSFFSIINCLLFSYSKSLSTWPYSSISITSLCSDKKKSSLLFWTQCRVYISPSNATCNALIISCSSKLYLLGSNPNFSLNFKNYPDASLQLLIFLSTKLFCTTLLHGWNFVSGINSYL